MELVEINSKKWFIHLDRKITKALKGIIVKPAKNTKKVKANCHEVEKMGSYQVDKLEEKLIDESKAMSFSKLVKKYMDEKNITTKDIYQNSLIDRKLFSALNVNDKYIPTKQTAIMYCFALNLELNEAYHLLNSAGYSLYQYSNFDIIVEYFLKNKIYNIDKLNDALYLYTKKCIGYR